MKAVVIGGSGLTGRFLIEDLLQDAAVTQVIAVLRRSLKIANPKFKEVILEDFDKLQSVASQLEGDLYFSCLGTTIKLAGSKENFRKLDHDALLVFGGIAKAMNARSFAVVSAAMAKKSSMFFYNQVKGAIEEDLISLGLRSLVIFRPALLLGARREDRPVEARANAFVTPLTKILPQKIGKVFATDGQLLARRMLDEGKRSIAGTRVIEASAI